MAYCGRGNIKVKIDQRCLFFPTTIYRRCYAFHHHPQTEKQHLLPNTITIQFLPCVATFDSYQDELGKNVRYLVSVQYCPEALPQQLIPDDKTTNAMPSSLLEIFDQTLDQGRS